MTKGLGRGHTPPQRCPAVHDHLGPCVLNAGVEGHTLIEQTIEALPQALPIHRNAAGQRWTLKGPYPPPARPPRDHT